MAPSSKAYRFQVRATDCSDNVSAFVPGAPTVVTAFQNGGGAIHYTGHWSNQRVSGTYGGSIHTTSSAGASAWLKFNGREVVWVPSRASNRGVGRVYIDGRLVKSLNLHANGTARRRAVFTRAWTSVGTHTIKVVCAGTAGHPTIDVDAFVTVR